jgi:hypothetical protein
MTELVSQIRTKFWNHCYHWWKFEAVLTVNIGLSCISELTTGMQILIQDNTLCVCRVGGTEGAPESAACFLRLSKIYWLRNLNRTYCGKMQIASCCLVQKGYVC